MGFNQLKGRAVFQSDLDGLEKVAGRKLVEFNRDKWKTLPLGWSKMLNK